MEETAKTEKRLNLKAVKKFFLRLLCFVLVTLLLLVAFLYGVMYIVCKGPSETARNLFVMSVRETSAIGFLADMYFSEEEIAEIEAGRSRELKEGTDTSLVSISAAEADESATDAWGYCDEDGDGIITVPVTGESYHGIMMIVLDPSRVVLGCVPETLGIEGYTVAEFAEKFDAVAAINGGGFQDDNGQGNGSTPNTAIVSGGNIYCSGSGVGQGFVGIDSSYKLHVGFSSVKDITDWDIQEGTGYGPVLVINGKMLDEEALSSGLNPRTAIGQRSDGAILMLVVDGRQPTSLGATYLDEAEIMLEFGAVNACNLDGGSSTLMWYNGEYINNCASVIGIRDIPTSFVVLKKGAEADD